MEWIATFSISCTLSQGLSPWESVGGLRHYRAFHLQQPLFCFQPLSAAVAVEFAVCADDTMTGNNNRHRVHGIGAAHGAIGMWTVDLAGNIDIRTRFSIWDSEDRL